MPKHASAQRKRGLRRAAAGFSLVEIMVGLLIGMLATLAVMQVYALFEGQKRSTTGTSDAQTGGAMGLYFIKRDMEMAGYGFPVFSDANSSLKCTTFTAFDHDDVASTPAIDLFPVVITDGGAGSDTIAIHYGRSDAAGIPARFEMAASDAIVGNNSGCRAGDWALLTSGTNCEAIKVTSSEGSGTGLPPLASRTDWGRIPLSSMPTISAGSISCIGKYKKDPPYDEHSSPIEYLYWVDNGQLVQGGNPATPGSGTPVMSGIVNLQAQYGVSLSPTSNTIVQWVDATGADWSATGGNWTTTRNRIKAVRVAIVARNAQLERDDVTNACSSLTGANPTGLCSWDATSAAPAFASPAPAIDLTANPDWRKYRYRVFETIVPLRSMIWSRERF